MTTRKFCFTLNNYEDADLARIANLVLIPGRIKCLIYGKEIGELGTPHLQGYVVYVNPVRYSAVKADISPRIHVEKQKCKLNQKAWDYCDKGRDFPSDVAKNEWPECKNREDWHLNWEGLHFGTPPADAGVGGGRGKRMDLTRMKSLILGHDTWAAVLADERLDDCLARHMQWAREIYSNRLVVALPTFDLRKWQSDLLVELHAPVDPRKVIVYVDVEGGTGKSTFARILARNFGAYCPPNKLVEAAYAYTGQKIILFDFARSSQEHINWGLIESLKNGSIFSTKYVPVHKQFDHPHMVIFTNSEPDLTKLSRDRWDVRPISPLQRELQVMVEVPPQFLPQPPVIELSDDDEDFVHPPPFLPTPHLNLPIIVSDDEDEFAVPPTAPVPVVEDPVVLRLSPDERESDSDCETIGSMDTYSSLLDPTPSDDDFVVMDDNPPVTPSLKRCFGFIIESPLAPGEVRVGWDDKRPKYPFDL
ncbi:replication-associated protein [Crucivirus-474]|nr:replication-associated protein [Crucivirus-474]